MRVRTKINLKETIDVIVISADNDEERVMLRALYENSLDFVSKLSQKKQLPYDHARIRTKAFNSLQSPTPKDKTKEMLNKQKATRTRRRKAIKAAEEE